MTFTPTCNVARHLFLATPRIAMRWISFSGTFSPLHDELPAWWELHNPTVAVTVGHVDGARAWIHSHVGGLAEVVLVTAGLHAPSQGEEGAFSTIWIQFEHLLKFFSKRAKGLPTFDGYYRHKKAYTHMTETTCNWSARSLRHTLFRTEWDTTDHLFWSLHLINKAYGVETGAVA